MARSSILWLSCLATLVWCATVHAHDQDNNQDSNKSINASVDANRATMNASSVGSTNAGVCASPNFASAPAVQLDGSPITIKSIVQGDQVCIQYNVQVADAGWFAVGFGRTTSMVSSPPASVLVYQKNQPGPTAFVIKGYKQSDTTELPDQSEIATFGAVSQSSALSFTFQRSLAALTSTQVAIDVTRPSTLIWAYGSSWPIRGHAPGTAGIATYNFASATSSSMGQGKFCQVNNCPIVFGGGAFALMVLGGLLVSFTGRKVALSHWLLHRSLMNPPINHGLSNAKIRLNPISMVLETFSDLHFGEVAVVCLFVAAFVALIATSSDDTTTLTGKLSVICMMFLFLPISRVPWLWQTVFGSSFERMIKFHRWIGMLVIVVLILHVLFALPHTDLLDMDIHGRVVPFYGTLSVLCFVVMGLLSFGPIRRVAFELFYYPHRVLSIVGMVFAILHTDYIVKPMIVTLVLYGFSLLWRWAKCLQHFRMNASLKVHLHQHQNAEVSSVSVVLHPTSKTKALAKTMDPCSFFWVHIPGASLVQWHPFSAIVTPQQDSIGFVVKSMGKGTYTNKLMQIARETSETKITLCGPFGHVGVNLDHYKVVILVAGGVGITPFLSLLNQYAGRPGQEDKQFHVIWSVPDATDLLMIDDFASANEAQEEGHAPRVHWMRHVSRAKATTTNCQEGMALMRPNGQELSYLPGRPILDEVINSSRFGSNPQHIAVLACGPPTLVAEAQVLARTCHFDFHKEVFGW